MHVRPAIFTDISTIVLLGRKLLEMHSDFDSQYYQLEPDFDRLFGLWVKDQIGKDMQFLLLAETDTYQVVGFISGFLKALYPWFITKSVGHIGYMYVLPEFQRQKVGRLLEQHATAWFKLKNVLYIELYVEEKNQIGQIAWSSYSFIPFKKFLQKKV